MTVGSLFAGIGGFDLAASRVWGWDCVRWQVEIDPWCRRVLAKHWPDVPKHGDIRELTGDELEPVDIVCGGFPCQPVSLAGEMRAQADDRWLWPEFARVLGFVGPRFVVVENVPGLLVRGMGDVLRDLAALGYDAEWDCLPSAAFGARHFRNRVFLIATARGLGNSDSIETRYLARHPEPYERWLQNAGVRSCLGRGEWATEPGVARVAYGVPRGLDRITGCGNAIVPQVAEQLFRWIEEAAPSP